MEAELSMVQQEYPDGLPAGAYWVQARLGGGAPAHEAILRAHERRLEDWTRPGRGRDTKDTDDGAGENRL
jgi:hypothetical protein